MKIPVLAAGLACALVGCSESAGPPPVGTAAGAASGGGPSGGGGAAGASGTGTASDGGSSQAGGGSGGAGNGGAPEPVFDATGLSVAGESGPALCRLSDDARALLVTIHNGGTTTTGPTLVRVSTEGSAHELRLRTPELAPGADAELSFARGPLVGFVDTWSFSVVIDPDAMHGGPSVAKLGTCRDLRSRAATGMQRLAGFYKQSSGLWDQDDWWTSANQLETVIDFSRETGDGAYLAQIDNTFTKNSSEDFDRWGYYDDDGWWAMAWIKAYDLSHQGKYLDMAKKIFARMAGGWDDKCGGGIYWASAKAGAPGLKNKNAIPNSLFLQVAAKLHLRTPGDAGAGSFLDWAQREWSWFEDSGMIGSDQRVVDGLNDLSACKPGGPVFTYNQGVLVGALVDLAAATGDASLLDRAEAIADATIATMADANGTLKETPCGGDICTQFKGIFMRNLAHLYRVRPSAAYARYMRHQSDVIWNENKNDNDEFGYEWHLPFDKPTASRQSSALDALIAAVASANLNLALGATATGSAPCSAAGSPANAFDGSSAWDSKWCSGGGSGQSLSVDLGAALEVVGFRVRHAGAGGENPAWNTRDFEIETSLDGAVWSQVVKVTGNTEDVTSHPIPAVSARHARLHVSQAQTDPQFLAARIYELEVLGTGR